MGKYINEMPDGTRLPSLGKAEALMNIKGAILLGKAPTEWEEGLVCVVDNGSFEAAGYAYSPEEMEAFKYHDHRRKHWLIVPGAKDIAK